MKKKQGAFSLVELMISLIIISVVLSALMPVITKRVGAREIYLGAATTPEVEYETKETGSGFTITSDMKNIKIKNLIAGGGGGVVYQSATPTSRWGKWYNCNRPKFAS